jgi:predicted Zn-dependent peptidase
MKLQVNQTTLDNGLRVLTCAMPHAYSVGVGFYLTVGSRHEERPTAGAAHFVEHMLFKGTQRRPVANAIATEIEGHGGLFNASTGQELTVLWTKMPLAHLPLALDVLSDMLRHSLFQPEEIEKERRVILEELSASQDVPEELVGLMVQDITWPDHPLGWDVAGTPESVATMNLETLCQFFGHHYGPQNTVLTVTGDVQHRKIVALTESLLADWQPGQPSAFLPAPDNIHDLHVSLVEKRIEQTHLALHVPGLSRFDSDRYVLSLLNVILGEGMSSRLFVEIRERLGLAYAVDSYVSYLSDTGVLGVYAAVAPNQAKAALAAILGELRRLRAEGLDDQTLRIGKEFLKGRLLMGLEDTMAVAGWFGRQEALGREVLSVEEVLQRVEQITAQDVQRVAARVFRPGGLKLAVVGPHQRREIPQFASLIGDGVLATD